MLHMKKNQVEINVKDRIRIARDTATVFQYMHHLGIVHRDIKSHNVLIDNSLNVKVCDFGLAKFVVSFLTIVFSFLTLFCIFRPISVKDQCSMQVLQLTWLQSCSKSALTMNQLILSPSAHCSGKLSIAKSHMMA